MFSNLECRLFMHRCAYSKKILLCAHVVSSRLSSECSIRKRRKRRHQNNIRPCFHVQPSRSLLHFFYSLCIVKYIKKLWWCLSTLILTSPLFLIELPDEQHRHRTAFTIHFAPCLFFSDILVCKAAHSGYLY